jgi:hypothetical protein
VCRHDCSWRVCSQRPAASLFLLLLLPPHVEATSAKLTDLVAALGRMS